MAWTKHPTRKNGKKYKRFSSAAIKTGSSGPSTAAVFPGGRIIPEAAKPGFDYRHRGTTLGMTDELVEQKIRNLLEDRARIAHFFGEITEKQLKFAIDAIFNYVHKTDVEDWSDPKIAADDRLQQLMKGNDFPSLNQLDQLAVIWQSEFRQRMHYWNRILFPLKEREAVSGKDFLYMYFEGNRAVWVEREGNVYRRSIIYSDRVMAKRAYSYNSILWVERVPTSAVIPPCSADVDGPASSA